MRYFLLLLICLTVCVTAYSQDKNKPAKPTVIEANLTIVDASGKPVDGVKREDVTIFENDVPYKLTDLEQVGTSLTLGIAVDNSNSTKDLFGRLIKTSQTVVRYLRDTDETALFRFVSSSKIEILEDFTSNKTLLFEALDSMFTEGGQSAVLDAVQLSTEKLSSRTKPDSKRRSALLLVSDCDERDSYYDSKQVFEVVAKSDVQVFSFCFTGSLSDKRDSLGRRNTKMKAEKLGRELALITGGAAYILDERSTDADLIARLQEFLIEVRSPYIVRYTTPTQLRDGVERKLRVEIADGPNGAQRQGVVRSGYVVPKD